MMRLLATLVLAQGLLTGEAWKLTGGMQFTEGPAVDAKGDVYFTDIPAQRIMKWDGRDLTVWREKSGGANGLRFDKDGNLYACEGMANRITRISPDQKEVKVLAETYNGKKLNCPNDLALDAKGGIYFTDPVYGSPLIQDKEAVYYIPPAGGALKRVVDDLVRPNGIEIHGDRLYIADHGGRKVYVYGMNDDGTLKDKKVFCEVACDGLKTDAKGNVYTTTKAGIEVFSPEGKLVQTVAVPEIATNCSLGDTALYITAGKSLYAIALGEEKPAVNPDPPDVPR